MEKQLPSKAIFRTSLSRNFPNVRLKKGERLVTKIVKEIKFGGAFDELESKKRFQRQLLTKYLRLTILFVRNSSQQEKFNSCFSTVFC